MIDVQPCSYDAAHFAVMRWHYSKAMPSSSLVKYGVWEDGLFIGAVLFGRGSTITYAKSMGVGPFEVCELVRVALTNHTAPVTEIVARCIKVLKADNPGLRVILSFADPNHGHHGGIYIAGNWIYTGTTRDAHVFMVHGKPVHPRTVSNIIIKNGGLRPGESRVAFLRRVLDPDAVCVKPIPKHRYVYPLDKAARRAMMRRSLPYPEPCGRSVDGDTTGFRPVDPGSTPGARSAIRH